MTPAFEELDFQETPLGEISLRRRAELLLGGEIVYEVKLRDEYLMSSMFVEAEIQLAKLALLELDGPTLDIVVGGLGLGYTAAAALNSPSVNSLFVIDVMEAVIDWHQRGLVPNGDALTSDPRCTLVHADFFDLAASSEGFDATHSARKFHAILLDIDHSPTHWLAPQHSAAYTVKALKKLAEHLHPHGVFGLWSNDPPEAQFVSRLNAAFSSVVSHIVTFPNPYTRGASANTVYIAKS